MFTGYNESGIKKIGATWNTERKGQSELERESPKFHAGSFHVI